MRFNRFFLCLLMSAPLLLFGAKHKKGVTETWQSAKVSKEFSMMGPKGWSSIDDESQLPGKIELIFVGTGKGGFTPSINVASEETKMTLQEYVKLAQEYHLSQEGETICRSLGQLPTKSGMAEVLQIDRKTQWGDVRFIQASLMSQGKAYVITATCLTDEFAEHSPQFFQAIRSFALHNDPFMHTQVQHSQTRRQHS